MVVFAGKGFQTRSDMPDGDWTGEALYVVPDGSALARKIQALYPYYDFVVENGGLTDVIEAERPPEPPPPPDTQQFLVGLMEGCG